MLYVRPGLLSGYKRPKSGNLGTVRQGVVSKDCQKAIMYAYGE